MTVNDLKTKYNGRTFLVKESGKTGTCIDFKGYRKDDRIVIRFCLRFNDKYSPSLWYSSDAVQPVRETLF